MRSDEPVENITPQTGVYGLWYAETHQGACLLEGLKEATALEELQRRINVHTPTLLRPATYADLHDVSTGGGYVPFDFRDICDEREWVTPEGAMFGAPFDPPTEEEKAAAREKRKREDPEFEEYERLRNKFGGEGWGQ